MDRNRKFVGGLTKVLAEFGIASSAVREGGKHPRLVFEIGGREHFFVFPKSPSSARSLKHCRSDLRRYIRHKTQGGDRGAA